MEIHVQTGVDPAPFILAGLVLAMTLAGGVAAFAIGFAGAAGPSADAAVAVAMAAA